MPGGGIKLVLIFMAFGAVRMREGGGDELSDNQSAERGVIRFESLRVDRGGCDEKKDREQGFHHAGTMQLRRSRSAAFTPLHCANCRGVQSKENTPSNPDIEEA